MSRRPTSRQEVLDKLLAFHTCPFCTFDLETGEGERNCHYGECPYLPEQMNTRCPTCNYDFLTDDLVPECGDPPTCHFARTEAPLRVQALRYWLEHQAPV